jgi:hypothetical protein
MAFFEDDNHRLHGGRIAGVLYILALGPWFGGNFLSDGLSPMGLARIGFTAGWWLAFCDKQSPRLSQLFDARHTVGVIMTAFGLAAQFYLLAKK